MLIRSDRANAFVKVKCLVYNAKYRVNHFELNQSGNN